ncbi:MAG: sulfotransferase family protein [Planctomycetota bacterium]
MPSDGSGIPLPHPLYFSTLRNWLRLLYRYGRQFDRRHTLRLLWMTTFIVMTIPIRVFEWLLHGRKVHRHRLSNPPVFIIGHWRSGTTNMHNLLLQDPQFTSVTLLHCAIPSGFLTWAWLARWIMKRRLPKSRPMDAVPLGIDEPMSEDFALAGLTHMSHYLNYFFPRVADLTFQRTVLFNDASEYDQQHWMKAYSFLLRKVSFAAGGKRLLLKNPPNLGRVSTVLKLYPDAKFIHVYRNPYVVHASTLKLMDRFLENLSFQDYDRAEIEQFVSRRYAQIFERWFQERQLIPSTQLIELRHEDIIARPMDIVADVYRKFGLPGWPEMKNRLQSYVDSLKGYQNNEYHFDAAYLQRINPYAGPIADQLGYCRQT